MKQGYTIDEIMKCGYWYVPYIPLNITYPPMDKNEMSKLLYKQNPIASLLYIRKGYAYYEATVDEVERGSLYVQFEVPISDMGDADFLPQMEAKFLRRWILK